MFKKITAVLTGLSLSALFVSADVISGPRIPTTSNALIYLGAVVVIIGVSAWLILRRIRAK
jgi:hypothetical protein